MTNDWLLMLSPARAAKVCDRYDDAGSGASDYPGSATAFAARLDMGCIAPEIALGALYIKAVHSGC